MDSGLIIGILTPILLTVGGIISWVIKSKREEFIAQEEKARDFKIKTYETLLEPFIGAFTFTITEKEKEINKLKTIAYKHAAFNLMTFGSDSVITSYNKLMQAFYSVKSEDFNSKNGYAVYMLKKFSDFLLEIRRDVYSKKTKLMRSNLIEFMITDIENHRKEIDE